LCCGANTIALVRADQFDPAPSQTIPQRIAVVRFVGNHAHRLLARPARAMSAAYADRRERRFRRAGLPPGMQSEAGLPEEHPGRRPPPSTSSPCPAWFSRLPAPLFSPERNCRPETIRSSPVLRARSTRSKKTRQMFSQTPCSSQSRSRRQHVEGCGYFSGRSCQRAPLRRIHKIPSSTRRSVDPRTTALAVFGWLGKQGRDFLPLRFGRQRSRPCHRPSLGAADFAYRSFQKPQLPLSQWLVPGCATSF